MSVATAGRAPAEGPAAAGPSSRLRLPTGETRSAVLWATVGCFVGLSRLDDNSFLWHLKTGHWILEHGVPRADIYSYTFSGAPWVAQSWLAEVVYALLDRSVGPGGIRVLNGLAGALLAFLAFRLAVRLRGGSPTWFVVLPAVLVSGQLWVERPLLLGLLAALALVWIVELPESRAGRRPLLVIPLLMWAWANVHGTFVLGFGYLGLHLLGRWLDGARPWCGAERRLLQASALGLAACFVNPYGATLVLFPFDLIARGKVLRYLREWQSPDLTTALGMSYALWIAMLLAVLALAATRPTRRDVVVTLPFMLLGLWAVRNVALAPLVALPVLARLASTARPRPGRRINLVVIALVLLSAGWAVSDSLRRPAFDLREYPVAAMRQVERQGLLGRRLLTSVGWGGYVIHAYWPRQKVYIDDRVDMYPVAFTERFMKGKTGLADHRPILDRFQVELVVWETDDVLAHVLGTDPAWRRLYSDDIATVFVRR